MQLDPHENCPCHQSEKPQPEHWEDEFDELDIGGDDSGNIDSVSIAELKSFIRSLLLAQKEQMLEVVRGMKSNIKFARKMVSGGQYTLDSCQGCNQTWSSCVCVERNVGYNSALSDVEEKWKDL